MYLNDQTTLHRSLFQSHAIPCFFISKRKSFSSMSSSLVGSAVLPEPLRCKCYKKPSRIMAACIENPRTEATKNPIFLDSDQPQIDSSLHKLFKFTRPNLPDFVSEKPTSSSSEASEIKGDLWMKMREEAKIDSEKEPILAGYYFSTIISQNSLEHALSSLLGNKLSNPSLPSSILADLLLGIFTEDPEIKTAIREDLRAVKERDPACISLIQCLLNFKGFQACQAHRAAHSLWNKGRTGLALLIQSRVSEVFAVDIHPGAKIGKGILFDHGTGVVIGETAVIGNNVSILHNVTLGGTGKVSGDRHPKIRDGVLVGAGTHVLGNVRIGDGAKIGAGSVVLKEVPARTTAVGNPARLLGGKENPVKLDKIPSFTMDHTSFISEWSDYVI